MLIRSNIQSEAILRNEGEIGWFNNVTYGVQTKQKPGSLFEIETEPGALLVKSIESYGTIVVQPYSIFDIGNQVSIDNFGQFNLLSHTEITGNGVINNHANFSANCNELCYLAVNITSDSLFQISANSTVAILSSFTFSGALTVGQNSTLNGNWITQDCTKASKFTLESDSRSAFHGSSLCSIEMRARSFLGATRTTLSNITGDSTATIAIESGLPVTVKDLAFNGTVVVAGTLTVGGKFQAGVLNLEPLSTVIMGLNTLEATTVIVTDLMRISLYVQRKDQLPFTLITAQNFNGKAQSVEIVTDSFKDCEVISKLEGNNLVADCAITATPVAPNKPVTGKIVLIVVIVVLSFVFGVLLFVLFRRQLRKAREAKEDGDARESLIGMSNRKK
jgi:hypothetical protein